MNSSCFEKLLQLKFDSIKKIIEELGILRFRSNGFSMFPTINNGEIVNIIPVNEIKIGDILLYGIDDRLLLHRVIKKGYLLCVKGDNEEIREYIKNSSVLGKYTNINSDNINFNNINKKFIFSNEIYSIKFQVKKGILEEINI
ncbi:MAG: S26 family signal peptidase [Tissierellia bacterium]|nr:S26 family signal peptidase [Tissierellia bacterium]